MADITFKGGKAEGKVSPPPSKSHTHRAIVLAALSGGKCRISNPLISLDTEATMDAVRAIGAEVSMDGNDIIVECKEMHVPEKEINAKNSGTTLRLMTGVCATFDKVVTLTGDYSLQKRPMMPMISSLYNAGVKVGSARGNPPVQVCGPIVRDTLQIKGNVSSQFISGLLVAAPLAGHDMTVRVVEKIVSRPYIDITIDMMGRFGVKVEHTEELNPMAMNANTRHSFRDTATVNNFTVKGQKYSPADYTVPADFSSAAFPLVAGALGGKVTVTGMDMKDPQGDKKLLEILEMVGCKVEYSGDEITCTKADELKAIEINMGEIPDLFPIVAVLLSTAKGTSRIYGAPQLRFKESDRIAMTEKMLKTLGADITGTEDGCVINGVERLHGGRIEHDGDHRMMMAAAVASIIADGPVSMADDGCWNVSYPGFVEQMQSLGISVDRA